MEYAVCFRSFESKKQNRGAVITQTWAQFVEILDEFAGFALEGDKKHILIAKCLCDHENTLEVTQYQIRAPPSPPHVFNKHIIMSLMGADCVKERGEGGSFLCLVESSQEKATWGSTESKNNS